MFAKRKGLASLREYGSLTVFFFFKAVQMSVLSLQFLTLRLNA